jgi:2-oxoglutarate dehydrogenase E2 component (dihydrolipoamide succinyltransferase)
VTKQDILGYIERAPTQQAPSPRPQAPGAIEHPTVEPWPGDRVEPWSRIRKITADHMVLSKRVSAHVASFFEVDFTRVAQLRAKATEKPTFLAYIVKACAVNLRKHPVVNAAVSGDSTIYRAEVNIGIAVALDWGLIVPVIKHADELSLMGIARAISDLGERARTKKLSPDDIQRGTFTITNPGGFGPFAGIPIINQPQVAILGVGAIEKRPRVVTATDGTESIAIRTMGMLTMSYDHRVVDGADADKFLADVKKLLQEFPEGAM